MFALNYLYFFAVIFLLLSAYGKRQCVVFLKAYDYHRIVLSGKEYFACILFATGVFAFSAPAGVDLMALRLFALELLCVLCLLNSSFPKNLTVVIYCAFMTWLIAGMLYTDAFLYSIRTFLKYLYMFLIILVFSRITYRQEMVITSLVWGRRLALFAVVATIIPGVYHYVLPGVFWTHTALAINCIFVVSVSIALYFHAGRKNIDLCLALFFCYPCIRWVFRTSILGTTLSLMSIAFYRYKIASVFPILALLVGLGGVVLLVPSVREKTFFRQEHATLDGLSVDALNNGQINTNGRTYTWQWALEKHFSDNPITGYGTGHLQNVFYSGNHPFGSLKIIHNDYIQVLCDNGIIGMFLLGAFFSSFIVHCFLVYQSKLYSATVKLCALSAGGAMTGMMLTLYTDNVINYTMCTVAYPCAVYGMMLGLIKSERRNRRALQ